MKWLWRWFTERWPFYPLRDLLLKEEIPGGASFAYTLGTSLIVVVVLQVVSGVLQLFYYVPTVDHAYDSVSYLRTEVPFGWLIHNMHYWGAQAMVLLVVLHMMRVYVWGAYKKTPLTWFVGIGLLLTTMAISFTGAPLIWDQAGYWAGEVGSSIAGEVPVVGDLMKITLRGGEVMGQLALSRFFAFHIGVFVPVLALLIGVHMASFRTSGVGGSWDEKKRMQAGPLWPDQIFKDMITATVVFLVLIGLSAFSPVPFKGAADTLNISYVPKPEWNFLFVYQALKYFPGPLEPIGAAGVPAVFVLLLVLVPLIDRRPERNPFRRPLAMAGLVAYAGALLTLTVIGYLSPGFAQIPAGQETKPSQRAAVSSKVSPEAEKGRQLFQSSGCLNCHKVNGEGGSVGPELAGPTLKGRSRQWLIEQITNSRAHFPKGGHTTSMTAFTGLSRDELGEIASYLMSLAGNTAGEEEGHSGVEKAFSAAEVGKGKQVFQSNGCSGCHKVNGLGGSIGPELSGDALKGRDRRWLTDQIRNPKSHNPNSIMPPFANLGEEQLHNLVSYLMSLTDIAGMRQEPSAPTHRHVHAQKERTPPSSPVAGPTGVPPEERALKEETGQAAFIIGSAENGADLYREQCVSCHGPEGKGSIPNPGSDDGVVPPLGPIDPTLYDTDPKVFAMNIDKIIQHGSLPSGPRPALHMPAWGDTRSLTQEEISNLEAYIMALNGVDRGRLLHPGVEPRRFFFIVLAAYVLFLLVQGGLRIRKKIP
jgi:quinol-cytochrome oxidoreductase complex cytochrome b subunit/cytochrome c551/c552